MIWAGHGIGNWFRDRCVEAGVPGRAHGLRKAGATIAAENGATTHELMAIFGWKSLAMAEKYTRAANQGLHDPQCTCSKHQNKRGQNRVPPTRQVGLLRKKTQKNQR